FMNYKINLFFLHYNRKHYYYDYNNHAHYVYDYNFCDFLTLFSNSKSMVKIPATPRLKYLFAMFTLSTVQILCVTLLGKYQCGWIATECFLEANCAGH